MNLRLFVALFAALALVFGAVRAMAQTFTEEIEYRPTPDPCERSSRLESTAMNCDPINSGASYIREREITFPMSLQKVTLTTGKCQAEVELAYVQTQERYARINGVINTSTCAAAGGDLVLAVRSVDANGATSVQQFPQEWQRSDAQPLDFNVELPLPADSDLVRVRAQRISCTCADGALAESQ